MPRSACQVSCESAAAEPACTLPAQDRSISVLLFRTRDSACAFLKPGGTHFLSPLSPRLFRPSSQKHPVRETSGGLQSFPKVNIVLASQSHRAFRLGAHVPGSSKLRVGHIFRLTSRGRADRPGNGYRPRAAGEQLIQSWKGALVVKPFNGLSPMIISPGLELANSEPL